VVWSDVVRTLLLVGSVVLSIVFVVRSLGITTSEAVARVAAHPYSQIFFFEDMNDSRHFLKQFLAGVFMVIAITGLDQDIMQRVLSSRSGRESQRNMVLSVVLQSVVIFMFLVLGVLLYIYAESSGVVIEKADNLFAAVATSSSMPLIVGVLFVLGLLASTYSSAGSALTALTTSFTVDILHGTSRYDEVRLGRVRRVVHLVMALVLVVMVVGFESLTSDSAINTFYTVAGYSYGPLLGLFLFGLLTKRSVRDRFIPIVIVAAPLLTFVADHYSEQLFGGYKFGFEVLLLNAAITMVGLYLLSIGNKKSVVSEGV
jgi:Na+/proline symporter